MDALKGSFDIDRVMRGVQAKKVQDEIPLSPVSGKPQLDLDSPGKRPVNRRLLSRGDKTAFELLEEDAFIAYDRLRNDPAHFIALLREELPLFDSKNVKRSVGRSVITSEGKAAVEEAIEALQDFQLSQAGKRPRAVRLDESLSKAARQHAMDIGRRGSQGHKSTMNPITRRRTVASERIDEHDKWIGCYAESISYAESTGEGVIKQLLVDDGVRGRGNRAILLSNDYGLLGIGANIHYQYRFCCVLTFAHELEKRKRKEQLALDRALEATAQEASKKTMQEERQRHREVFKKETTNISAGKLAGDSGAAYLPAVVSTAFLVGEKTSALQKLKENAA